MSNSRRFAFEALFACVCACDPGNLPAPAASVEGAPETSDGGVAASRGRLTALRVDRPVAMGFRSGDDDIAAAVHVQAGAAGIRLGRDDALVARAAAGPRRHVRLDQFHRGARVWGADVVAHLDGRDIVRITGNLVPGLDVDASPSLPAARARELAVTDHARARAVDPGFARKRESAELVVVPGERSDRLAWHVRFVTVAEPDAPGRWNFLIDAHDGVILQRWNDLHTTAQASGPGGTPKFQWAWKDALDVEPQGRTFAMDTPELATFDMTNGDDVVTGPLANIGDSAINDAHGYAEVTLDMLTEWFGHHSLDDNGLKIVSHVHFGDKYENAFWDGAEIFYGDGDEWFYPLSGALDVVAHELNHGFTEFHSGLMYFGQSGGMNESFSDIAGAAAEFYLFGDDGDLEIGEDVSRIDDALRWMCEPILDGLSIDHIDDYDDSIDVHFSSGIMNKAFCRAARRLSSGDPEGQATAAGVERAARAFYAANAHYWTASATFKQGCEGVLDAALDLGYTPDELAALQVSWADVGLSCAANPRDGRAD